MLQNPLKIRNIPLWSEPTIASLIGLCLWFTHFGKATRSDEEHTSYPPMHPAIEFLSLHGREIAIACMFLTVVIFLWSRNAVKFWWPSGAAAWLAMLNSYLTIKLLVYGNTAFFFPASAVIIITVLALAVVASAVELHSVSLNGSGRSVVVLATWIFAALLTVTNLYAHIFYPDSAWNDVSRLHGTTGNPQHLAMMGALASTSTLYYISRSGIFSVLGLISFGVLAGIVILQYFTGSRMGFGATVIGVIIFLRSYISGPRMVASVLLGGFLILLLYISMGDTVSELLSGRFVEGREDSRSEVWISAWQKFVDNPLFGAEPQVESGRLAMTESFWLSAASNGGIVALTVSLVILYNIITLCKKATFYSLATSIPRVLMDFYLSSLVIVLFICMFEAALLGIMTTYTMLAYLFLAGAQSVFVSGNKPRLGQGVGRIPSHRSIGLSTTARR